jgi:signal transduction histidine kinase
MKKKAKTKAQLQSSLDHARIKAEVSKGETEIRVREHAVKLAKAEKRLQAEVAMRKRANSALARAEAEVRFLSSKLLLAEEYERKRIAQEVHDGIGQALTAIKIRVENVLRQIDESKAETWADSLRSIIPIVQQSLGDARRIQTDLRPSILDDLGLLAAIDWFCREFQITYPEFQIEKQFDLQENEIPDLLKVVIFRTLQEGMNNCGKHSKTKLVWLVLERRAPGIEFMIKDNGVGFEPGRVKKGLGLDSMKERVEISGGVFHLDSVPGKGTTIRVSWV